MTCTREELADWFAKLPIRPEPEYSSKPNGIDICLSEEYRTMVVDALRASSPEGRSVQLERASYHLRRLTETIDGKFICSEADGGFIDEGFIVASDYDLEGILKLLSHESDGPKQGETEPMVRECTQRPQTMQSAQVKNISGDREDVLGSGTLHRASGTTVQEPADDGDVSCNANGQAITRADVAISSPSDKIALRKAAFALSCADQFWLASMVAENVGYELRPDRLAGFIDEDSPVPAVNRDKADLIRHLRRPWTHTEGKREILCNEAADEIEDLIRDIAWIGRNRAAAIAQGAEPVDRNLVDLADEIEQSDGIALMLTGTMRQLGIRRSAQVIAALRLAALRAPSTEAPFQERVRPWMIACFGDVIPFDRTERNHRFLEEALELVQALDCTQDEAHQLVDYVFGRPKGEPYQEVGGVRVTLSALCNAATLDENYCAETELARIWTKVEQIRAKQAAKPKHGPLPGPSLFPATGGGGK